MSGQNAGTLETGVTDKRLLLLSPNDNVLVLCAPIHAGEEIMIEGMTVTLPQMIGLGHKLARQPLGPGDKVLKYGAPIGTAARAIGLGDHVHINNLKSDYTPTYALDNAEGEEPEQLAGTKDTA
jgi:altronate dehydratase small subunit